VQEQAFHRLRIASNYQQARFLLDDMALRKIPAIRYSALAAASFLALMLNFAVTAHGSGQNPPPSSAPGAATFRARVTAILNAPETNRGYWGLLVEDADTGEVLFSQNADHYFLPASNAKLFTTALAMDTLGPEYKFHTTVETRSPMDADGTISGDLVLVGRGDPDLSNRVFPFLKTTQRDGPPEKILIELADAVQARGVKKITGDVIGDDSFFAGGAYPSGWSIDDMLWNYGAPVSALEINDGTLFIELQPGAEVGVPTTYTADPWAGIYQIKNSVITSPRGTAQMLTVHREPGSTEIDLSGTMPLGGAAHSLGLAIDRPAEYAAAMLKNLLETRGIEVYGKARARHFGDAGAGGNPFAAACCPAANLAATTPPSTVLAEHISLPLSDALTVMDKISQNLHAEMLWRVAARENTGDPTEAAALQFEEDFRKTMGLADDDAVMSDASGLSRRDLVTPQSEVAVLLWAAHQPWAETYRSFLPVAGQDGTLMDRMVNTPAAGHVWAKTGSLTHDDSLAGYATSTRGSHLVFSFMGNNHNLKGPAATAVLDALAVAMVQDFAPSGPPAHK
jgi:serine-type D-Ala-D-Ala carboxypeptidase/endopeptidase (penicillin-binding protein 4)